MTDLEMMEQAAKAAGMDVHRGEKWQADMLFRSVPRPNSPLVANVEWNPLADDGDALRLAVNLRVNMWMPGDGLVQTRIDQWPVQTEVIHIGADECAATRRAIVRAAADLAEERKQDEARRSLRDKCMTEWNKPGGLLQGPFV